MEPLFSAYSTVDGFRERDGVHISWLAVGHAQAPPYDELVTGYRAMGAGERARARAYVDRLFTAGEIDDLRAYLARRHGWEVDTVERDFPGESPFTVYSAPGYIDTNGWLWLGEPLPYTSPDILVDEPYDLPFVALGLYDLEWCPLLADRPPTPEPVILLDVTADGAVGHSAGRGRELPFWGQILTHEEGATLCVLLDPGADETALRALLASVGAWIGAHGLEPESAGGDRAGGGGR